MNVFYVYEHWRLDTDTCFYVGKGKSGRAYSRNRNKHWKRIVQKLENTGSAFEVRIVASNLTQDEAFSLEKERIAFWLPRATLANHTLGGEGWSGGQHSEEFKKKISQIHKGKIVSEETRSRLSKALLGNPKLSIARKAFRHSEESKQKMRENFKGRPKTEAHKQKLREANLGKRMTDKMRSILIAANTGRSPTDATREKIRQSQKGKIITQEQRDKIKKSLLRWNAEKRIKQNEPC
jgi:hypothetical protein